MLVYDIQRSVTSSYLSALPLGCATVADDASDVFRFCDWAVSCHIITVLGADWSIHGKSCNNVFILNTKDKKDGKIYAILVTLETASMLKDRKV